MFRFFGVLVIGALTGYLAEKFGFTRHGIVVALALGVGGAVLLWFTTSIIGVRFGFSHAFISFIGAAGLLLLARPRR